MPRLKICGITDAAFAVEAARRGVDYLGLIFAKGSLRCVTVERAREIIMAVTEWREAHPCPRSVAQGSDALPLPCPPPKAQGSDALPMPCPPPRGGWREAPGGVLRASPAPSHRNSPSEYSPLPPRGIPPLGGGQDGERRPDDSRRPYFVGVFVEQDTSEILKISKAIPIDVIQLHRNALKEEIATLKAKGFDVWRLAGVGGEGDGFAGEDAVLLDGRDGGRTGGTGRRADWSRVAALKDAGRRVILAGGLSAANIAEAADTGADILDVNSALETSPGRKSVRLLDELLRP